MKKEIILVNAKDEQIGLGEKLDVHKKGLLHRAFSIFIFNSKKELLIQKRAKSKYHSGGLWANTCCSHPKIDEKLLDAVHARLQEEMGFDCPLKEIFSFTYKVELDNNLVEHELDHVFIGLFDEDPKPNPAEVEEWKWISIDYLLSDIKKYPQNYAYWFNKAINQVVEYLKVYQPFNL